MTLDPAKARQARDEAALRYQALATTYVPEGWTVATRKSLTGRCYMREKRIEAPVPKTRKSLYIFLHECAHAHLHVGSRKPRHVEEMEAEQWAHTKMRENDIPVPREMTQRAKAYVAWKIRQAVKRGAKTINKEALAFAKSR